MRQNADTPRTRRLLADLRDMQAGEADPTTVNGQTTYRNGTPITADWVEAEPNKVQSFIGEGEWGKPVYNVDFIGDAVLQEPCLLKNGSELVWLTTGWRGVCRRISPDTDNNEIIGVTALVVILAE